MPSGGSYVIKDGTESVAFPAPVTTIWNEQVMGEGVNGVVALDAYRAHTWRWANLPEEYQAKLTAFQTRQQTGNAGPTSIETDAYDAPDNCEPYRTTVYTDVVIRSITRERGLGMYAGTTITFEILVN